MCGYMAIITRASLHLVLESVCLANLCTWLKTPVYRMYKIYNEHIDGHDCNGKF